ncbi:MAG: universal stress protein [Planctomycetota bacterium]
MQLKNIVVATDFSTASRKALQLATILARDSNAHLWIIHVAEPRAAYTVGGVYASFPVGNELAQESELLQQFVPEDPKIKYSLRLIIGEASEQVVKFVAEQHADLLVIGTHGRTGLTRLLLGSCAEKILRTAACPVITLKG